VEPETRYVRNSGTAIAYQVLGSGDTDLVYVPDYMSNLVFAWQYPRWRDFYLRLARSFRLILFDKRGTGLSDHGGQFATLETRMEDLHAVLDAAGSEKAVILASHEGCGMAALFAATYPERVSALALFHPAVRGLVDDDPDEAAAQLRDLRDRWGTQEFADELLRELCQTLYASEEERRLFANYLRVGASPAVAYALNRAFNDTDLSDLLPAVRVPALILYRALEREPSIEVANRIPGAQATQVSGSDYLEIFLSPELVDEIELFVAGVAPPAVPERVLATVMFTDIVGSTEHVAELGDGGSRPAGASSRARAAGVEQVPRQGAGHGRRRLLRFLRRTRTGDPVRRGDHRRARAARPAHARGHSRGRVRAPRWQARRDGGCCRRAHRGPGRVW
jgi:pimeloyl-ACP methyl ester carboxylesterase